MLGLALGLGLAVLVPAAVDDEADAGETRARRVNVKLFEFGIRRQPAFVAEGKVKFVVKNIGTEKHEFVVAGVQPGTELTTAADGSVDEEAVPEDDAIGEIENIKPKAVKSLTKRLDAGEYELFCNIVEEEEDGTVESHYREGCIGASRSGNSAPDLPFCSGARPVALEPHSRTLGARSRRPETAGFFA